MIFRETDTYPTQETNIESLATNEATTINKVIRPILVSSFVFDLDTQFTIPNCIAPCDILDPTYGLKTENLGLIYAEDYNTISIKDGICIIHEVTVQLREYITINIQSADNFFDTRPITAGSHTFWAAVKLVTDTTASDFNDGLAQVGMFGLIDNYIADPDDYVLLGGFELTLDSEGDVIYITGIVDNDDNPEYGRKHLDIVDDGWLPPIPQRFLGIS